VLSDARSKRADPPDGARQRTRPRRARALRHLQVCGHETDVDARGLMMSLGYMISGGSKLLAVIIMIVTGLLLAFGDAGGRVRRLIQLVFGQSIAFAASSLFLSVFSFGGGVLI